MSKLVSLFFSGVQRTASEGGGKSEESLSEGHRLLHRNSPDVVVWSHAKGDNVQPNWPSHFDSLIMVAAAGLRAWESTGILGLETGLPRQNRHSKGKQQRCFLHMALSTFIGKRCWMRIRIRLRFATLWKAKARQWWLKWSPPTSINGNGDHHSPPTCTLNFFCAWSEKVYCWSYCFCAPDPHLPGPWVRLLHTFSHKWAIY